MDNDAGMRPRLIEASAENYLYSVLSRCNYHRTTVYYYVLNIGISILFVMIAGFTLYRCYTNKPSEYEKMLKLRRDQEYVLSKIRFCQEEHNNKPVSSITGLPSLRP
jgi:hypothetical protein